MWADNETTEDLLGYRVHADLLRSVIRNRSVLPTTIGLFGDWGSGKTSIMRILEDTIDPKDKTRSTEKGVTEESAGGEDEKIAVLYFNTWTFEGYDDAKSAITASILKQLASHQRFGPKVRTKVQSLLKSVNWMRVMGLGWKHAAVPAVLALFSSGATLPASVVAMLPFLLSLGPAVKGGTPKTPEIAGGDEDEEADSDGADKSDSQASESEGKAEDRGENSKLPKLADLGKKKADEETDVRTFRERFAKLLRESDIDCLVILVDDLDRCSPERIIENLEAIKLYLNVERTVFIIGADRRIVRHAIAVKYAASHRQSEEDSDGRDALVTDYLEKLVQIPYHLPRLSPVESANYMTLLFSKLHLEQPQFLACLAAHEKRSRTSRNARLDRAGLVETLGSKGLPANLDEKLVWCGATASLITKSLKGNPRQIKRFLNAYILRRQLAEVAGLTHIRDDVLVKLMILEYLREQAFRQLFDWQSASDGLPLQIKSLEDGHHAGDTEYLAAASSLGREWDGTLVRQWIGLDPALAEVDLRDYFWIARDRLESSLENVRLVPPAVSRAVADLTSGNHGKTNGAVTLVNNLSDDEREMVYVQLAAFIKRKPTDDDRYSPMRLLVERGVKAAGAAYGRALTGVSAAEIPAGVAAGLVGLARRPDLAADLAPMVERISKAGGRGAKAVEKMQEKPRRG